MRKSDEAELAKCRLKSRTTDIQKWVYASISTRRTPPSNASMEMCLSSWSKIRSQWISSDTMMRSCRTQNSPTLISSSAVKTLPVTGCRRKRQGQGEGGKGYPQLRQIMTYLSTDHTDHLVPHPAVVRGRAGSAHSTDPKTQGICVR